MSTTIETYPEIATPQPAGHADGEPYFADRDDESPERALFECYDLWASGAWADENAVYNLEEVMGYVARLLQIPESDPPAASVDPGDDTVSRSADPAGEGGPSDA